MQLDIGLIKLTWYLSKMCDGWVIDNLLEYGNSVLPVDTVNLLGINTIERILKVLFDDITIRKTACGYIAERN